jgi:Arc/MetJ-type ribon-helix-helix transcriptional regulator
MTTNLSPENEQYIQNAIASGLYHDRGEILDRAVELLKRREQLIRDVNLIAHCVCAV